MANNDSLLQLYTEQLRDLYSAEQQILQALPKMAQKAQNSDLREALQQHEQQTRQHVQRLEQVFQQLGQQPSGETCKAMQGLVTEGDELMKQFDDPAVRDAAIIAAAQRVEHYEMAGYGTVRTFANQLGYPDQADLLQDTLDNEEETDARLTDIAESMVNADAM